MTATDAAGNVGNDTAVVTIDTVAPNAPVLDPINATDPVSGQAVTIVHCRDCDLS
ncbi:hypothetical protein ACT42I_09830 [Acinetobacter baumannii]